MTVSFPLVTCYGGFEWSLMDAVVAGIFTHGRYLTYAGELRMVMTVFPKSPGLHHRSIEVRNKVSDALVGEIDCWPKNEKSPRRS